MKKRSFLMVGASFLTIAATAATVVSCGRLTKEQVDKQTTVELTNKDEIFKPTVDNIKSRLKITASPKNWEVTIEKVEYESGVAKVTLKATDKKVTYTLVKQISLNSVYDKFLEITIKNKTAEVVKPENYKDYFTDDFTFDSITTQSTDANYQYELDEFNTNTEKGELVLSIILKDKDGNEIAKFQKTISGFKSKLPEDENDANITIKNLAANQYITKNAGDIKEEDIQFNSKSDKYKYEIVGIEANDAEGKLTINYKQYEKGGLFIAQHQKLLEGFAKITAADLTDPEERFESGNPQEFIDKADYGNYQASDIIKKNYQIKSKSGKYQYMVVNTPVADDLDGTVTFKLKWAIRNGVYSNNTIDYVVSGFKHQVFPFAYKIIDPKDSSKEVKPEDYGKYYANEFSTGKIKAENQTNTENYYYKIDRVNIDPMRGQITLDVNLYKNDDWHKIKSFKTVIAGFKKLLPVNKDDLDLSIKDLAKEQYNTKHASDVKKEDLLLNSKSSSYKYSVVSVQADDSKGTLTAYVDQLMLDGKKIVNFLIKVEGFKKITEADKTDPKLVIEGLDESQYGTVTAEQAVAKVWRLQSKSNKFDYREKLFGDPERVVDKANGTITFKLYWKVKGAISWSTEPFEWTISGFKKA